MSQVSKMVKLLLVMPATNAQSEQSFAMCQDVFTYNNVTTTAEPFDALACSQKSN